MKVAPLRRSQRGGSINKVRKWPASLFPLPKVQFSGANPKLQCAAKHTGTQSCFTASACQAVMTHFDCAGLSLLTSDIRLVCPCFQTLLIQSPTALGYYTWCHPRPKSLLPTLVDEVCCLACWLLLLNFLGCSPSPGRFSMAQDSKTAHLLSTAFITTNLTVLMHGYTHHSAESILGGTPYPFKLSARPRACALRAQSRQISLVTLRHYCRLSSLRLVTRSTVSRRPRVRLVTHTSIDRHIGAFPLRGRVRVAQYFLPRKRVWNGVEGGITASSAPVRLHELHYEHAATAV